MFPFWPGRSAPRRSPLCRRRFLPGVERLEARIVPSIISVNAGSVVNVAPGDVAGVNIPDYSPLVNDPQTVSLVQAAGLRFIRESPGGNTDFEHFYLAPGSAGGYISDSAATLALAAEAYGADNSVVTVNYGTGSPGEAAAFAAYLDGSPSNTTPISFPIANGAAPAVAGLHTAGSWASLRASAPLGADDGLNFLRINHPASFNVKYFEFGNEVYFDTDNSNFTNPVYHIKPADAPTGQLYVQNAKGFSQLAQQIDPSISVGVDVGSSNVNDTATGGYGSLWTAPLLQQCAAQNFVPGFLSDHMYVFSSAPSGPGGENDSALLHSVSGPNPYFNNLDAAYLGPRDWGTRAAQYRADLTAAFGAATGNSVKLLATEWNSEAGSSKISTNLVAGLFVADSIGSLLQTEYGGSNFWDLRNSYTKVGPSDPAGLYGWRTGSDDGMLGDPDFNSPPQSAGFVPYPTYFGFQLWAQVLQPGDGVVTAGSDDPSNLGVYALKKQNGHLGIVVINKSAGSDLTEQLNIAGFTPSGSAQTWQYGEANDNAQEASPNGAAMLTHTGQNFTIANAGGQASFSFQFPRYSMTAFDLAPATSAPTAVNDLFVLGADNQVYFQRIGAQGTPLSGGYQLAAGGSVLSFVVGTAAAGHPELFALGLDNQAYGLKFDANFNPVGSFFPVAGGAVKSFAAGHDLSSNPELFAIGFDSQVYTVKFDASGSPTSGYALAAAGAVKSLGTGNDSSGNPTLFALGIDSQIYQIKFGSNGNPSTGYTLAAPGQVSAFDVGHDQLGHPWLFALGLDSQVYSISFTASSDPSGGYSLAAAGKVSSFGLGYNVNNGLELFAVGLDNQVYSAKFNASAQPAGGYALTVPVKVESIVVGQTSPSTPELFAIGFDSQVYSLLFDSAGNPLGSYTLTAAGSVKGLGTVKATGTLH